MTVGELVKMPPEERAALYDRAQGNNNPDAINSEAVSIESMIDAYDKTEIPLDDMGALTEDILAVLA